MHELPKNEQLNYDLYRELLESAIEGLQYGDDPLPFRSVVPGNRWMPIDQMNGIQQGAAMTLSNMPHESAANYEDILARLESLPAVVDQVKANLEAGLKKGYTQPKITMRDVPQQIANLIPADATKSALLQPFQEFPASFPEAQRTALTERAKTVYAGACGPRVPAAARLCCDDLPSGLPGKYCRNSIARRGRSVCVPRALADDNEADSRTDSRDRIERGETNPNGDGQGSSRFRVHGKF